MLVINENNRRLLNMKEKLLEVTTDDNKSILDEYEKIAKEIDSEGYNQIINKIKSSDYDNMSLEEQIKFLSEIEDDYNYLNQLQWMIRNKYSKYSSNDIQLSNISNILIDNIIERISDIHGYLMNIKNLESNKVEVDRLNSNLISLEKEKEQIKGLIGDIRNKIKNDIIGAEGRIYTTSGNLIPISINSELNKYDVRLSEILNNSLILADVYKTFSEEAKLLEEKYEVAIGLPIKDDEVCQQIELDMIKSKYKLALIELINQISSVDNDYVTFKDTLYRMAEIIDNLKNYSKKMGVRFYINPFDRIKIESQIQVINSVKDVDKEIRDVKKTITYITSMIDEATEKNSELIEIINSDIEIIKNDDIEQVSEIVINDVEENDIEKTFNDIILNNGAKDNQIIKVADFGQQFRIDRVREKTDGVIKRVFEMVNNVPIDNESVETPELILEPIVEEDIVNGNNASQDIDLSYPEIGEVEANDNSDTDDIFYDVTNESEIMKDTDRIFPQVDEGKQDLVQDNSDNVFLDDDEVKTTNEDLFKEVVPFDETPLFSDRYDSGIFEPEPKMVLELSHDDASNDFENKNSIINFENTKKGDVLDAMMPEAFWVTKDDNDQEVKENNILSFDEQVAKLMEDDDKVKTKKKIA